MLRRPLILLVTLVLSGSALAGCGGEDNGNGGDGPEPQGETVEINGETANDHGTYEVDDFEKIALDAGDFYFEPTIVTGPAGLEVELDLVTDSETTHNLSIPELDIDADVTSGDIIGNFATIPESGTLTFFCKYHREQGMVGGLQAA